MAAGTGQLPGWGPGTIAHLYKLVGDPQPSARSGLHPSEEDLITCLLRS